MSTSEKITQAYETKAAAQAHLVAAEYTRTITRASVKEAIRDQILAKGEKITEARLDDLAHIHADYVEACTEEAKAVKSVIEAAGAVCAAEAEHALDLVKSRG